MSRRLKKMCKLGVLCIVGGVVLVGIGGMLGAKIPVNYQSGNIKINGHEINRLNNSVKVVGSLEEVTTGVTALDAFDEVEINLRAVDIQIIESDGYGIELNYRSLYPISYEVRGGSLFIKQSGDRSNINEKEGTATIYIPKDISLKKLKVDNGMGDVEIAKRSIDKFDLDMGMGDIKLEDVVVNDLDIDGGMGDIRGNNLTSYNTEISVGMGKVDLEGDLDGDVVVEGGMGSINLETTKPYAYYNYILEKGMGAIKLNGDTYNTMENVRKDNGAQYTIRVNGGMGKIEINTMD